MAVWVWRWCSGGGGGPSALARWSLLSKCRCGGVVVGGRLDKYQERALEGCRGQLAGVFAVRGRHFTHPSPTTPCVPEQEVHAHVRKWITDNISPAVAKPLRILYGGSGESW